MDELHIKGVVFIQTIQKYFKDESSFMILISHLSDPKNAFLFYFPLVFCLHRSVGKRVLWVAAISEWLNAVFKWILHGERPYWWVSESNLYKTPPHLEQFDITCETGPGSPSGHCMVTSAVIYIIVSDFLYYTNIKSFAIKLLCWSGYVVLLMLVCLSRCFIAAHFPHQVIAGTLVGVLIGMVMNKISTTNLSLPHYLVTSLALLSGGVGTFYIIQSMDLDPFWSISKAERRCANPEWIHLDSSLFFSIVRDFSSLIGLGLGLSLTSTTGVKFSPVFTPVQIVVSLALTLGSDWVQLPNDPVIYFYLSASLKFIVIFICVVAVIPKLNIGNNENRKQKKKKK
ncbi:hypothetical protein SNE40_010858 [Patella caerulea]|uniref:Glucose-6-phosphatase n=1 Tax=Patella caerulea TaxID=87958 RepID=A0AAN8PV89_PATCE